MRRLALFSGIAAALAAFVLAGGGPALEKKDRVSSNMATIQLQQRPSLAVRQHVPASIAHPAHGASADSYSACRAATEIEACHTAATELRFLDRFTKEVPPNAPEAKAAAAYAEQVMTRSQQCGEALSSSVRVAAWRRAALLGSVPAMKYYSSGRLFERENLLGDLDALQLYRKEARGLATMAAQSGDIGAMLTLANAYDPMSASRSTDLLPQALAEQDARKSLSLYINVQSALGQTQEDARLKKLVAHKISLLRSTMAPAEIAEAENLSSSWGPPRPLSNPYRVDKRSAIDRCE